MSRLWLLYSLLCYRHADLLGWVTRGFLAVSYTGLARSLRLMYRLRLPLFWVSTVTALSSQFVRSVWCAFDRAKSRANRRGLRALERAMALGDTHPSRDNA